MKRRTLIRILILVLTFSACSQSKSNNQNNAKMQISMEKPYPFQVLENEERFTILVSLEREDLFKKYYPLFEKHGYEGNGYCWEGHIVQILEKKDKELLTHIEFDPEAGAFYAYTDSKEAQARFINLLSPIFYDIEQLEQFVKSADRDRVDD